MSIHPSFVPRHPRSVCPTSGSPPSFSSHFCSISLARVRFLFCSVSSSPSLLLLLSEDSLVPRCRHLRRSLLRLVRRLSSSSLLLLLLEEEEPPSVFASVGGVVRSEEGFLRVVCPPTWNLSPPPPPLLVTR